MSSTGQAGIEGYAPKVSHGAGNPEALKYGEMWKYDEYRKVAPGEQLAAVFLEIAKPRPGARVVDFGCGTGRGAFALAMNAGLIVTMVDFVNNCLDAEVRAEMLATQGERLTFVKADLERGPLPVAEYGYCTDVMEHIPPDKVDAVLTNILTAAQRVFFAISTVDDSCGALIGQPLHLTVKPYAWWLAKLAERGAVIHWSQDAGPVCLFYVSTWATSDDVNDVMVLNVAEQQIRDNVRANTGPHEDGTVTLERGPNGEVVANLIRRWQQVAPHEPNDIEVMILGGGPSLADHEAEIRERRAAGAKIVTLNGAYGWALERGLGPVTQIMVDAREFNQRFVQPIREDCVYLLSSQCHPAVFEGLPRERTYLWHTTTELIEDILKEQYPAGWFPVPGGSTALLRAIPLLRQLGYSKFHLYGCDSCLTQKWGVRDKDGAFLYGMDCSAGSFGDRAGFMMFDSEEEATAALRHFQPTLDYEVARIDAHHAYAQPENDAAPVFPVVLGYDGRPVVTETIKGRVFYCQPWMLAQAHEMIDLIRSALGGEFEMQIHGDGLLAYIVRMAAAAAPAA